MCLGFRTTAIEDVRRVAGAVVGKPSEKEPAGNGRRRCRARYGDFGAVPADVAAANVAGGVIVRRRGAGDAARDALERELDANLSFCGLGRMEARTSATAAGPGPARSIGAATADRSHDVSILMAGGLAVGLWRGS